jgi:hypothetical protein
MFLGFFVGWWLEKPLLKKRVYSICGEFAAKEE